MNNKEQSERAQEDAFRHVLEHRTMLAANIRATVLDFQLAEDTLSDVSIEIVRNWDRYDSSRPFAAWARGIARRIALANLRKQREQFVLLDDNVLDAVGAEMDACGAEPQLEALKQAPRLCVEELSGFNRVLVRLRYFENKSYKEIGAAVRRTVGALYVAFNRIHKSLRECVEKKLGAQQ